MKLYKWLLWYWVAMVASMVLGLFDQTVLMIFSLAASVVQLYALAKLRPFHERIQKSFTYTIICLVLMIVTLLAALLGISTMTTGSGAWVVLLLAVLVASAVFALLSSYHFYWALDELRDANGYDYPDGRIRWCFYLAIISVGVTFVVQQISYGSFLYYFVSLGFQIAILALLWRYIKAVQLREEQENDPTWPEL